MQVPAITLVDRVCAIRVLSAVKQAVPLMVIGALAAVLAMAAAFYTASGKPDSDPDITRAAAIPE